MRFLKLIPVVTLMAIALCCQAPQSAMETWIRSEGGTIADSRQEKAEAIVRQLGGDVFPTPPNVHILAADELCGYAWPKGDIFLTRGLIDRLDDTELAAAIAHEMGHLVNDPSQRAALGLRGSQDLPENSDQEQRADAAGVELLRRHHLPPKAMVHMLNTVLEFGAAPTATRRAIQVRIDLLSRIGGREPHA